MFIYKSSHGRFDDCLKLRRRVDEKPYLLPDPPLFKALAAQNAGANLAEPVPSDHLQYTHFGSIQNQAAPPESQATIFKGNRKVVFLAKDLGVSPRLRETLEHVVKRAGGKLVTDVLKCQVYIGSWREKEDYIQVSIFLTELMVGESEGRCCWKFDMVVLYACERSLDLTSVSFVALSACSRWNVRDEEHGTHCYNLQ